MTVQVRRSEPTRESSGTRSCRQAAVIPFRVRNQRVEVVLVTTPGGKRWVFPKGSLDEGEQSSDAAVRETEEEAGLLGELEHRPLGRYQFIRARQVYEVDVYLMQVTVELDSWMESKLRRRRWLPAEDAAAIVRSDLQPFVHKALRLLRTRSRNTRQDAPATLKRGIRG
ncbi:MAG: NUDIX hydrolase [Vicinamibacterales bacterium]